LTGPGGSVLTSGAGRRKQPRGPKDRRLQGPKRLQGPPRAAPRCRKRSAAESRPQTSSALPRIGAGVGVYWRRCVFPPGTWSFSFGISTYHVIRQPYLFFIKDWCTLF